MKRQDHLLTIAAEECMEVGQRATKALRFGLDEIQPGQDLSNADRLLQEYADLVGVLLMLAEYSPVFEDLLRSPKVADMAEAKRIKVEEFLAYSDSLGRLY